MRKNRIHIIKEAILAALIILLITWLVSFVPLKFEFLKAIRQDFNGFDIYDLYYAGKNDNNHDSNIVLIQIANDRKEIATQINLIKKYKPAVIAVDAIFKNTKDSSSDALLEHAVENDNSIILVSVIDTINNILTFDHNYFETQVTKYTTGYINMVGGNYSVIRNYPPFLKVDTVEAFSFSSRIVQAFSPEKFNRLKARGNEEEIINYKGNTERYTSITGEELIEYDHNHELDSILKRKIILLGYFVKYPPFVLEDIHFSPLNPVFAGKSFPDMYGVVIHANIVSMILDGNYAKLASHTTSYFIAFLLTFLLLYNVLLRYAKKGHASHARLMLIQFILVLLVLFVFLQLYNLFLWKVHLLPVLISLAICIELQGVYKILALFLNKHVGYKTVFKPSVK